MEKLGVSVESGGTKQGADADAAGAKCPRCGAELEQASNVKKCPKCGTAPFEDRP